MLLLKKKKSPLTLPTLLKLVRPALDSLPWIQRNRRIFFLSAWLDAFVTLRPVKRLLGYGWREQLRDTWRSALASAVMAAAVYAFGLLALPLPVKLCAQVLLGCAVYALSNLALKNESFFYLLAMLRKGRRNA